MRRSHCCLVVHILGGGGAQLLLLLLGGLGQRLGGFDSGGLAGDELLVAEATLEDDVRRDEEVLVELVELGR